MTTFPYPYQSTVYRNSRKQLHRTDGPAVASAKCLAWWQNGQLHNENGPAVILLPIGEGEITLKYYIRGVQFTAQEYYLRNVPKTIVQGGYVYELVM